MGNDKPKKWSSWFQISSDTKAESANKPQSNEVASETVPQGVKQDEMKKVMGSFNKVK